MKNTQTHSPKTFKKLTHINVRHIPDSGQYIPVMNKLSAEYDTRHKSGGGGGATLKPQANPPDESSRY